MEEVKSQRDYRRAFNAEDQHGRPWLYEVELKTMDQTAEMRPAGWTDPLRTPIKHVKLLKQKNGQPIFDKVRIQWREWVGEARRAMEEWKLNLWNVANDLSSGLMTTDQMEADPRISKMAGPKPWPPVEALELAMGGHAGLLGTVPTHLADGRPNSDLLAVEARKLLGIVYLDDFQTSAVPEPQPDAPAPSESIPTTNYQDFIKDCLKRGMSMAEGAQLWTQHKANLKEA
jgi:hypothetical protein